ncbi:MAG TPA: hypothetical protein V6D30_03090 [Leptolyngbyaceae cyanobacterium]
MDKALHLYPSGQPSPIECDRICPKIGGEAHSLQWAAVCPTHRLHLQQFIESVDTVKGAQLCAPTSHLYFIDLKNAINGTGLTNTTVNTTYQTLVQGVWGRHSSPSGGFGGNPPILVFLQTTIFRLSSVPFDLTL